MTHGTINSHSLAPVVHPNSAQSPPAKMDPTPRHMRLRRLIRLPMAAVTANTARITNDTMPNNTEVADGGMPNCVVSTIGGMTSKIASNRAVTTWNRRQIQSTGFVQTAVSLALFCSISLVVTFGTGGISSRNLQTKRSPKRFTMAIAQPAEFNSLNKPSWGKTARMVLEKGPMVVPKLRRVFRRTCACATSSTPVSALAVQAKSSGVTEAPMPQMMRDMSRNQAASATA
mmetsp:Transcript_10851/g.23899  ORF Transcript_10851/g.23899 Transcript_10851/m.23899 type:complete len:230 (+) Transcript_10851:474-1163(+)